MTHQLEALEEFKVRSTLMADNLEKDSRAVLDHVGHIQADHDRVATMAAGAQTNAVELHTVFEQLSQLSSDLHSELTMVAEEVSRLRGRDSDTP